MGTVSSIVSRVRLKLNDYVNARWTDANMIVFAQDAVERTELTLAKFDVQFAKKRVSLPTVPSQGYVALPSDFLVDCGLFREATGAKLTKCNGEDWEAIISATELAYWIIFDDRAYLKGVPSRLENLTLQYYTKNETSGWTAASMDTDATPWGGKCDSLLVWYMSVVAANVDGMDWTGDQALMQDLEKRVLETFAGLGTTSDEPKGAY